MQRLRRDNNEATRHVKYSSGEGEGEADTENEEEAVYLKHTYTGSICICHGIMT